MDTLALRLPDGFPDMSSSVMNKDSLAVEMGERLRSARNAKGLSQAKLAKQLGDSGPGKTGISNYEQGIRRISYSSAVAFSKVFNMPAAYFLCELSEEEAAVILAMRASKRQQ